MIRVDGRGLRVAAVALTLVLLAGAACGCGGGDFGALPERERSAAPVSDLPAGDWLAGLRPHVDRLRGAITGYRDQVTFLLGQPAYAEQVAGVAAREAQHVVDAADSVLTWLEENAAPESMQGPAAEFTVVVDRVRDAFVPIATCGSQPGCASGPGAVAEVVAALEDARVRLADAATG